MRCLLSVLSLLIITGCATTPKAPFDIAQVNRVAIVSLLGDEANVYHLGVTAFGNQFAKIDIEGANLDQHYEAMLEDTLTGTGRFEVVDVTYDRATWIAKDQDTSGMSMWQKVYGRPHAQLQPMIKALADEYSLDAVFVLAPLSFYTGAAIEPEGPAIYKGGQSGKTIWCRVGVFAGLVLANGKDGHLRELRQLTNGAETFTGGPLEDAPAVRLRDDDRKVCDIQGGNASAEQLEQIKQILSSVITPQHFEVTVGKLLK